jgi:phosphatidylserine decarboxylase
MGFAKEGYIWVFIGVSLTLVSHAMTPEISWRYWPSILFRTTPMALLTCFMIYFFRDPNRSVDPNFKDQVDNLVLAPADGTICAIQEEEGNLAVYVELHVTNVHVQRAHINGVVTDVQRLGGNHYPVYFLKKKIGADSKAIKKNARVVIKVKDEQNRLFDIQLICGKVARRAKPYVMPGDVLTKGQRVGVISFGSLVRITLPGTNYKHITYIGQNVEGGKTVLFEILK